MIFPEVKLQGIGGEWEIAEAESNEANVPTQPAEIGDLEACLGFVMGPLPRLAASFFAKRSFARRC